MIILSGVISFGLVVLGLFVGDLLKKNISDKNDQSLADLKSDLTEGFPTTTHYMSKLGLNRIAWSTEATPSVNIEEEAEPEASAVTSSVSKREYASAGTETEKDGR